jgi:hypothetical protein
MIKELLNEKEMELMIRICNNILSDEVTINYIVESLDNLNVTIGMIMPDDYIYERLARDNNALIDDILEMNSISDEEKQEAINELILIDKDKFITLAKDLLAKIESDRIEAIANGYCPELIKRERDEDCDYE